MQASDYSDVFVSYRRKDVEFTKQLVEALNESGKEVWVDWEDIPPGSEGFSDDIRRGLEGADTFICVLSPDYLESTYCVDLELGNAIKMNKRIVPIVLKKFDDYEIPSGVGHINWIYFTPHAGHNNTFDESFPKVLDALNIDLAYTREHKNILLRALDWDRHERHYSRLLRGQELAEAEHWIFTAGDKTPEPTKLHQEFLIASRKLQIKEQSRRMLFVGATLVVTIALAIAAVVGWIDAQNQTEIARLAQNQAEVSEKRAVAAQIEAERNEALSRSQALAAAALQPGNEALSVALALEAARVENPPAEVFSALMHAAYPPGIRDIVFPDYWETTPALIEMGVDFANQRAVMQDALVDLRTGAQILRFTDAPPIALVAEFLPGGDTVLIGGDISETDEDGVLLGLYDVDTGRLLFEFDTDGQAVDAIYVSADGFEIAAHLMPADLTAIYEIDSATYYETYEGGQVAFSSDFVMIADLYEKDAEDNWIVEIFDATSDNQDKDIIIDLTAFDNIFLPEKPIFSPNAQLLALKDDSLILVFEVATGKLLYDFSLEGSDNIAHDLDFSPDSRYLLATSSFEATLLLWDMETGRLDAVLPGDAPLMSVDFVDNDRVLALDIDGQLLIRDLQPGNIAQFFGQGNAIYDETNDELHLFSLAGADTPDYIRYAMTDFAFQALHSIPSNLTYIDHTRDFSQFLLLQFDPSTYEPLRYVVFDPDTGEITHSTNDALVLPITTQTRAFLAGDGDEVFIFNTLNETGTSLNPERIEAEVLRWQLDTDEITADTVLHPDTNYLDIIVHPDKNGIYVQSTPRSARQPEATWQYLDLQTGEEIGRFETGAEEFIFTEDGAFILTMESATNALSGAEVVKRDANSGEVVAFIADGLPPAGFALLNTDATRLYLSGVTFEDVESTLSPRLNFIDYVSYVVRDASLMIDTEREIALWEYNNSVLLALTADDAYMLATDESGAVLLYRNDSLQSLIEWTCANRSVPEFNVEQREQYNIQTTATICDGL